MPITWDEALDEIADKIMELRENNETHKYMLMRGRYTYMRDIIYDRMTKIIGSPNNISHSALCAEADKAPTTPRACGTIASTTWKTAATFYFGVQTPWPPTGRSPTTPVPGVMYWTGRRLW